MVEDWIGVQAAAELLSVTRQMVHKLIKSKVLSGKRLSATGAWMMSRREVVAYPTTQVLSLAEKVAKGKDGELRFMADMTAVLNRLPDNARLELAKKVQSLANREETQGIGSAADRYRSIADFIKTMVT